MNEKSQAVALLTGAINKHHGVSLSTDAVGNWVGSDASKGDILEYYYDVDSSRGGKGVTPDDVLSLMESAES